MVKRPVFKKKIAIFMVFLLMFQLVGWISPVFAEGDSVAPLIHSLELNTNEITSGEKLLIKASVTDDVSGVKSLAVLFDPPSQNSTTVIRLYHNEITGLYEGEYTIDKYTEAGKWTFRTVIAEDKAGNTKQYKPSEFPDEIFYQVFNEMADNTPPVVKSIELSDKELVNEEKLKIKMDISDDLSGVKSVAVLFDPPSQNSTMVTRLYYNAVSGLFEGEYTLDPYTESGKWTFRTVIVEDIAGNSKQYKPNEFPNEIYYMVFNNLSDNTPPVLNDFILDNDKLAVGEKLILKANITDDVSGVKSASVLFDSPSKNSTLVIRLNYNSASNLYESAHPIEMYSEEGVWTYRTVIVEDIAGNTKQYKLSELSPIPSNYNFEVIFKPSDLDLVELNDPSLPYAITTKNEAWINKTIDKDLYIGPDSTITIADNVTITGNVYLYGTLISHGGLTIQGDLNAKSVTYGSNSSASPGAVRIVGGQNSIGSMIVSNQPYDVPFAIYNENLTNEMGTAVIEGKTLPFLDVSLQGNPVALEADGSFKVTAEDITSDGLQFNLRDIFGNDMIKDIAVKDVLAPASVSGFTVTKTTNTEVHVSWAANKESDLKEYILSLNGDTTYAVPAGSTSYVFTELKEGTPYEFTIAAIDQAANKSGVVKVNETTLLSKPVVNPVSEKDGSVTGQAYPGTLITVKKADAVIGTGTVGTAGNYNVVIDPQKAGTELSVVASNKAGVVSEAAKVVVEDKTAPSVPTVIEVTDQSTKVEGTGEVASTITIKSDGKELATGKVDVNGNYSITIAKQIAGTELQIFSVDAAGNVSESKTITVIDVTKPSLPQVNAVTDTDTTVTGIEEAGAEITVTA